MASPTVASLFTQRYVVGVGDVAVSNNPMLVLSTYALGSCVGVVVYDKEIPAGGLLHIMLPNSATSPAKAAAQPAMFADTGLPQLFSELASFHAEKSRLKILVAGGAHVLQGTDPFRIGDNNVAATLGFMSRNGYSIRHREVGDTINRTLHLSIATGQLTLKSPRGETVYELGA